MDQALQCNRVFHDTAIILNLNLEPSETPTKELAQRWKQGDQRAADELFWRYQKRLLNLVRSQLNVRLQSRLDAEDLVQSIMRSAFRITQQESLQYNEESGFWKWLVSVALNKTFNRIDRETADKRDVKRESSKLQEMDERIAQEPTPADVTEFADLLENILSKLTKEQCQALIGKLEGLNQNEIADRLNVNVRTVQRMGPALRRAAIATLGFDVPDWIYGQAEYQAMWKSVLSEKVSAWLPPLRIHMNLIRSNCSLS